MAGKIYVGDVGTDLMLDVGQDITGATVSIEVIKQGGSAGPWSATVYDSRYVRHISVPGDFDVPGPYKVNPQIALADGSWSGTGKTAEFHVHNKGE